ncbi:Metallophosphoesterase 1 [Phytophthora boehmeriae]|uniref:Metallophosphoesterase 1 n=1 Tax=Phytophthora boehmeriae TaxID=109152 RepID=A0A8T1X565_9STRA|nr:Metallophosphoesterase 1 [Phytophthora boehmeriae]
MLRWELALLATVLLLCQAGVFYLQAWRCERQFRQDTSVSASDLTVLVVTDVHLLGKRRRSWVERLWVDWQVHASARAAVDVHRPGVVLVLGDQLDEGSRWTSDSDWEEYAGRFFRAFSSFLPLKTLYLVGNHDTAFGRDMRIEDLKRYEVAFGPANRIDEIDDHVFVSLNTMALDADVQSQAVKTEARSFFKSVDFDGLRARTKGSVILLTHLPLFRADDLQCGEERLRENGHVTYEHPGFKYESHHHVLSQKLSGELLDTIRPDLVLSGHTHAWCAYQHADAPAKEYTIPAFSWGQRPDPSYALFHLQRSVDLVAAETPIMTACHLPREPLIFATYAVTVAILVLAQISRLVSALRTPKTKSA